MSRWKRPFKYIAKEVTNPFRKLKLFIKQRLGWLQTPVLLPFHGYGNNDILHISGRVLEDNGLAKAASKDSFWQNMWAMYKRFVADEIPGVRIQATFKNRTLITTTNESGIFEFNFDLQGLSLDEHGWDTVTFELLDDVIPDQKDIIVTGKAMFPPAHSDFGIISDVDDTFLISHATKFYKKMRLMLLKNARTRMPFKGVAAFYRALHKGRDETNFNPIFYVSSSEYNLYDLLVDFCEAQNIPKGPFLLKELKTGIFDFFKSGGGSHQHKYDKIKKILHTFCDMNFILIGDSGQHDAELYSKAVKEFPGRVNSIYIRDVRKSRHKAVKEIAAKLYEEHGVEMLLVKDTEDAAKHAIDKGYIPADYFEDIHRDKEKDEKADSDLKQIIHHTEQEEK